MTLHEIRTRAWNLVHRRKVAYLHTFCHENGHLLPEAERVLADLRKFCGIDRRGIVRTATGAGDAMMTAELAGRRDVYMRISAFINIDIGTHIEDDNHDRPEHAAT